MYRYNNLYIHVLLFYRQEDRYLRFRQGLHHCPQTIRNHIEILGRNSSINVLIRGETGSGKEVVAYLIHTCSDRKDQPMVRINCSQIPDNLMESELFGIERGAFAGAMRTKKGC